MPYTDFRERPPRPDLAGLLRGFESVGVSCELGLIQRHCGIEQLGLFRFGYTPLAGLIDALAHDFEGLGEPELIDVAPDTVSEWITTHRRYGFEFHTGLRVGGQEPDAVREKMSVHFKYLARKLGEEIGDGGKVLVYRAEQPANTGEGAEALAKAVAGRGRAAVLWVMAAPERATQAEWVEPGRLMFGYVERFAPLRLAVDAAYDSWLGLLENAAALATG